MSGMATPLELQGQMQQLQAQMQQMMQVAQATETRARQAETQLAAAAAARPVDAQRTEIVDTRLLSKPKNFNGKQDEWVAWAFKLRAYLGALGGVLLKEIDAVGAAAQADVLNVRLTPEGQGRSRKLYYILVLLLDDQALQLAKPARRRKGIGLGRCCSSGTSQIGQAGTPVSFKS